MNELDHIMDDAARQIRTGANGPLSRGVPEYDQRGEQTAPRQNRNLSQGEFGRGAVLSEKKRGC